MIRAEVTVAYHGGGRRWFTAIAAARAESRAIIKKHCYCDHGDEVTPGSACHIHHDTHRYLRIRDRLAGRYLRAMRQAEEHDHEACPGMTCCMMDPDDIEDAVPGVDDLEPGR